MKFKVGDKVKVRSWESMEAEFGLNYGEIDNPDYHFVKSMKKYCGKYVTISGCHRNYYNIKEDNERYSWTNTMFENVVGHKFKVGDKVRIIGNTASHEFTNGDIVVVTKINRYDDTCTYLCADNGNIEWWASEEDIELVGKQSDKEPVVYQYLIVNTLSGIMFTSEDEDEQYLFTKEQVIEHLNNAIAYPSQWTVVSVNETFNVESIMKEVK